MLRLSGEDIFISYSRIDGGRYAVGLADALTGKGFSCFLDTLGTQPGKELPATLKKKIRSCTLFVLVGTEKAAESVAVEEEIQEFLATKRAIVPIDIGGALARARWYEQVQGVAVEREENFEALAAGDPSPEVVRRIEKSFRYTRRNQRMNRIFWAALSVLVVLLASIAVASYVASEKVRETLAAQRQAAEAREQARVAKTRAEAETRRAERAAQSAVFQRAARQALSEIAGSPERALLLAVEAVQRSRELDGVVHPSAELSLREVVGEIGGELLAGSLGSSAGKDHDELAAVAKSSNGRWLVAAAGPHIYRWDFKDFRKRPTVLEPKGNRLGELAVSPNGRWIAGKTSHTSEAFIWDVRSPSSARHLGEASDIQMSSNGKRLFLDSKILWLSEKGIEKERAIKEPYSLACFSPDSRWLVSNWNELLLLYPLLGEKQSLEPIDLLLPEASSEDIDLHLSYTSCSFDPTSRWLVGSVSELGLLLWDLHSGSKIPDVLSGSRDLHIETFTFSANGRWLVAIANSRALVWDLEHKNKNSYLVGSVSVEDETDGPRTYAVAFSPDGHWLVTGEENNARVWDLNTNNPWREPRYILLGHSWPPIKLVAFSPDSRWLVTGGRDLRVWDMKRTSPGEAPIAFGRLAEEFTCYFSLDSRWFAVQLEGVIERELRRWALDLDELIAQAGRLAGRNLTREEWKVAFPGEPYRKTFPNLP